MTLLNKFSLAAVSCAVAFLALAAFGTPAKAALFRFSFTGEQANGYFIYDDSVQGTVLSPNSTAYYGAVREYKVDSGKGIFEGTNAAAIVFLPRAEDGILAPETDDFLLQESAIEREPQSQFALVSYFHYPKGTFNGSTAIRTTVPSTAFTEIFPEVDFPITLGEAAFRGNVQTRIEKIPEPASLVALLALGASFSFVRYQRRQRFSTTSAKSGILFT